MTLPNSFTRPLFQPSSCGSLNCSKPIHVHETKISYTFLQNWLFFQSIENSMNENIKTQPNEILKKPSPPSPYIEQKLPLLINRISGEPTSENGKKFAEDLFNGFFSFHSGKKDFEKLISEIRLSDGSNFDMFIRKPKLPELRVLVLANLFKNHIDMFESFIEVFTSKIKERCQKEKFDTDQCTIFVYFFMRILYYDYRQTFRVAIPFFQELLNDPGNSHCIPEICKGFLYAFLARNPDIKTLDTIGLMLESDKLKSFHDEIIQKLEIAGQENGEKKGIITQCKERLKKWSR